MYNLHYFRGVVMEIRQTLETKDTCFCEKSFISRSFFSVGEAKSYTSQKGPWWIELPSGHVNCCVKIDIDIRVTSSHINFSLRKDTNAKVFVLILLTLVSIFLLSCCVNYLVHQMPPNQKLFYSIIRSHRWYRYLSFFLWKCI